MDAKAQTQVAEKLEDGNSISKAEVMDRTQGDVQLISTNNHVRRIPVPTNDPNDPLNFNKWRKLGIVITCCWFCKSNPAD